MPCLRPRLMLSGRLVLVQYRRMNLTTPFHCEMYQDAVTCRCSAAPRVLRRLVPRSRGPRTGAGPGRAATIRAVTDRSPHPLSSSIRATARDEIRRAWEAAIAAGALPALPADTPPVAIEVERPA